MCEIYYHIIYIFLHAIFRTAGHFVLKMSWKIIANMSFANQNLQRKLTRCFGDYFVRIPYGFIIGIRRIVLA